MVRKHNKSHMSIDKPFEDLLKNPDWQNLRKQLMNKWMCKPHWCCLQIRKFIGNMYSCNNNKLKIVSGYLSSSGFRYGAINYPCMIKLKNELFLEIKNRKSKGTWR